MKYLWLSVSFFLVSNCLFAAAVVPEEMPVSNTRCDDPAGRIDGVMARETEKSQLTPVLDFLRRSSKAGNVFTVKLVLEHLRYWLKNDIELPQRPSRSAGDLYYRTDKDREWFAKLECLVAQTNEEDLAIEVCESQELIEMAYREAFRLAAVGGHQVVMELLLMQGTRMRPLESADFFLCIARSSKASAPDERNFFVGVIALLLKHNLCVGKQAMILKALGGAKNEFVRSILLDYLNWYT